MIPIFEPFLSVSAKKNVVNVINKNWISSQGTYIKEFERKIAKMHKVKYCLVTSNCTTALHLSLLALGLKKGDEVVCPALTFIAPANMILLSNLKLKLVDIDKDTLTIDVHKFQKAITNNTKAVIVVHQFGHSADMDKIINICKKKNIKIIEDNAEAFGGYYKKKMLGTIGDIGTFSFFANKIITTGEGGAIITNSKIIYNKCKEMRDHGMSLKKKYYHVRLGFNYRMTNMQAAVGCSQIDDFRKIKEIRYNQMKYYYNNLKIINQVELRKFKSWCTPAHWLMTITLKKVSLRNKLIKYLKSFNIESRKMINPVFEAKYLKQYYNEALFPVSKDISSRSLHLPSGTNLKRNKIKFICKKVKSFYED